MQLVIETPQIGVYSNKVFGDGISVTFEKFDVALNELFCPVFLIGGGEDVRACLWIHPC